MKRICIMGNSGSGKTTTAQRLSHRLGWKILDLDTVAWVPGSPGVRRELGESLELVAEFIRRHNEWIIEGCYGDLLETVVSRCTWLIFLNPGVEGCLANNRRRPWEPHKYPSPEDQRAHFELLQEWVREYPTRGDEYSLKKHRQIFDSFGGQKREVVDSDDLPEA